VLTMSTGHVGLILPKASVLRVSIPLDLHSRSFIPLPRFIRAPLSAETAHAGCLSLRLIVFSSHHSFSVTLFDPWFSLFFYSAANKHASLCSSANISKCSHCLVVGKLDG
jgi:hypothetical protein